MTYPTLPPAAQALIHLVSCAVNQTKPNKEYCEQIDLAALYRAAKRHSLLSMTSCALEQVMKLPQDFYEAKKTAMLRLALYDIERKSILAQMDEAGIWYLPLKGILLKELYPKTSMREMTDNDILCDSTKSDEIRQLMESKGYSCILFGKTNHDVYTKPPSLDFEMHRALFNEKENRTYYDYFLQIKDRLIKDKDNLCGFQMTHEDFYLYLICHLHMHYASMGIGLRSLLDIYVFNQRFYPTLQHAYLQTELQKLELADFEAMVRTLSDKLFTGQRLDEKETKELQYFYGSGSSGTYKNYYTSRLGKDDSGRAKLGYYSKRVWMKPSKMKERYPVLQKHMVLYPFFLIYRPINALLTKPKIIKKEIHAIHSYKKDPDSE